MPLDTSSEDDHETVVPSDEDEDTFEDAVPPTARTAIRPESTLTSAINSQLQLLQQSLSLSSAPMAPPDFTHRQSDLPILDLETDRGDSFEAWLMKWDDHVYLSGLDQAPQERQVRTLRRCMTTGTLTILKNLGIPADARDTNVKDILKKLKEYAARLVNVNVEWNNLMSRKQLEHETIDDYVMALRQIARGCDTCNDKCEERAIRVQLVRGIRNEATTKELLKIRDLTLEKALNAARANEAADRETSTIHENPTVNRMSSYKKEKKQSQAPNTGSEQSQRMQYQQTGASSSGQKQKCGYCGYPRHVNKERCPAKGQQCSYCGKTGHFSAVCRAKPKRTAAAIAAPDPHNVDSPEEDSPALAAAAIQLAPGPLFYQVRVEANHCAAAIDAAPRARLQCQIGDKTTEVVVLPDFGADFTVIGTEFVNNLGVTMHPPRIMGARAANGSPMHAEGVVHVQWTNNGKTVSEIAHVMKDVETILIGWQSSLELGLLEMKFEPVARTLAVTETEPSRAARNEQERVTSIKEQLLEEFADVFSDEIKPMKGELFRIHLVEQAKPFRVTAPRALPIVYKEPLRQELDLLQRQGIIEPVTHPTEWCSPIVIEPKPSGTGIRLCVDLTKLNAFVKREFYYTESPARQVADISQRNAKFFTSIDATKGYHQCPLAEESKDLTTFITPFGRFRYKRAPFGLSSISEHYNRRMDENLKLDQTKTRRVTDDLALFDGDFKTHVHHVRNVLEQCRAKGITLSKSKFKFAQSSIKFAGFILSSSGYTIDPQITQAIRQFKIPSNITDLRAFFGLVNQLAATRPDVTEALAPLRSLLSPRNSFLWSPELTKSFELAKARLCTEATLTYFDVHRPTRLVTDASRIGLGFVLQQRCNASSQWRTVQAGSRFLTETEKRYAIVELELLAVCFAVKKCAIFLTGLAFTVLTDHQPLVAIMNHKRLDEIENPRLQRMRRALAPFQIRTDYIRGKDNAAADALSRSPHEQPSQEFCEHLSAVAAPNPGSARQQLLAEVMRARDDQYLALETLLSTTGFPDQKTQLGEPLRQFWPVRDELFMVDAGAGQKAIMCGRRVVIPRPLQNQVLRSLHLAHQGVRRTQEYASTSVFWPGINNDISNVVQSCEQCQRAAPANRKQPLVQAPTPQRPFQDISADFFQVGKHTFLVITDAFSNWPELAYFANPPTSKDLIVALHRIFAQFGAPEILRSDNGSQFVSQETVQFLKRWRVTPITSAPRYPQSNGRAESAVKAMKRMVVNSKSLQGCVVNHESVSAGLLAYRNTPGVDGLSPCMKLLGRQTRCLATYKHHDLVTPQQLKQAEERRERLKENTKRRYDSKAYQLTPLHVGAHVRIWREDKGQFDRRAVVVAVDGDGRRLTLKDEQGRKWIRDRRHVRLCRPLVLPSNQESCETQVAPNAVPQPAVQAPATAPPTQLRRSTRRRQEPNRYRDEY